MVSAIMVFYGVGMLVSYTMGGTMEYWTMVYTNLTMAVIGLIGLFFLKESPLHLMSKGEEKVSETKILMNLVKLYSWMNTVTHSAKTCLNCMTS